MSGVLPHLEDESRTAPLLTALADASGLFDELWPSALSQRQQLGDFLSVYCLESMMLGLQDVLGHAATAALLTHAGRLQGAALVSDWTSTGLRPSQLAGLCNTVLGYDGLRLCLVEHIEETEQWVSIQVGNTIAATESLNGEAVVSLYPFTLGVLWGILEKLSGHPFRASSQTEHLDEAVVFTFFPVQPEDI